jgi:hypothetical protein
LRINAETQFVTAYQIPGRSFLFIWGEIFLNASWRQPEMIDLGCPTPYTDFAGRLRSLLDSFAELTIYNLSS